MERPVVVPVHNLGAGGNTPPYWEGPPRGLGYPHAMFNAYFLREHHRREQVSHRLVAWVDSGGFLYIRDKTRMLAGNHGRARGGSTPPEPGPELVETVLKRQEGFGAHVAFTLDYPLHGAIGGEVLRRLRITAINAALAYQLRRRRSMRLLIVLQYRDRGELGLLLSMLEAALREYAGLRLDEVDGFAVGGLVPYRSNLVYLAERVVEARLHLPRGSWIHVLGVASPINIPLLYAAGADSLDSKTYIIAAAKRLWYTPLKLYLQGWPARIEVGRKPLPLEECGCVACSKVDGVEELRENTRLLALHNLHVTLEAARLASEEPVEALRRLAARSTRLAKAARLVLDALWSGKLDNRVSGREEVAGAAGPL